MGSLTNAARTISRVSPSLTALFVCDMQQAFKPHAFKFSEVSEICRRLVKCAGILNMQTIATEQYPKGLGPTIQDLELEKYKVPVFEKTNFTMCIPTVMKEFDKKHESVILCGVECHVCVLQTALDLIKQGIQVHVVADGVTSRTPTDRHFGLMQMKHAGACLRTAESVILELIGGSGHPKFKEIQNIIKVRSPDTGLLTHML